MFCGLAAGVFWPAIVFNAMTTALSTPSSTKRNRSNPKASATAVPMICVFGRPGAGKTTIAEKAISNILQQQQEQQPNNNDTPKIQPIGLDLDVCVPQWMRDNFAKGIYPTLAERVEFAQQACDYVETLLQQKQQQKQQEMTTPVAVISFSFVNTDLREYYRSRFPQSQWILVDTSESESGKRIQQRQGHFYRGKEGSECILTDNNRFVTSSAKQSLTKDNFDDDNSEWEFAPVEFEHIILDGTAPLDLNVNRVVQIIQQNAAQFAAAS